MALALSKESLLVLLVNLLDLVEHLEGPGVLLLIDQAQGHVVQHWQLELGFYVVLLFLRD